MNKTLNLTLALIKTSFDVGIGAKSKRSKPRRTIFFTGLLFGLFIASFTLPVTAFVIELVNNLKVIDLTEIVFYMVLPIATITVTVLSIFTVISILFLSTDNKILLYLPLTPRQIILARFIVVLVYTYLIEVIFLVPIFVGYGLALNLGLIYYLVCLIVTLIIPIIPLSLVVILLSYLLRYTNLSRYRDAFTYVAMALVLGLALGFNFFFSQAIRTIELDPSEILANVRSLLTVYGNVINQFLPYLTFALNGLVSNQLFEVVLNIGLLLLINVAVLGLVIFLAGPVYLKTIMGSDERSKSRRKNNISNNLNYSKNHFISLIILEWKTMVRSPIYFLNLLFIVFLVPLLIIGSLVFGISSSGSATQIDILEIIELLEALNYNFNNPFFVSILIGIALFFGSTTLIAPTAISRLGGSAPFFKSLPISYLNFINFKTFWANILTIIPISLYILGISMYGLLSIFDAMVVIITITPLFVLLNYLGLLIDLINPKLDWLNEAQAVKQNLNGILYMLGMWALTVLLVYGGYLLSEASFVVNGYIYSAIIFIVSVIGNIALLVYFKRRGYKLFKGVS
jgi:ABC-2 type transport system permease protein